MARTHTLAAAVFAFVPLAVAATTLEVWQPIPHSQEGGTTSPYSLTLLARDDAGASAAGVAVTYSTSPDCGSFQGANSVTVVTDADGHAPAPPFTATASERYCEVTADADAAASFSQSIYEFSADHVVIDVPASISVQPGEHFGIPVSFSADGVPIFPPPIGLDITSAPNGASASGPGNFLLLIDTTQFTISRLTANSKQGRYTISVSRGPVSATTLVDQHK